jgi:serine protease DegQ
MNRLLHRLIRLCVVLVIGSVPAHAFASEGVPNARTPRPSVVVTSYRDAVARAAPSVVTVYSAQKLPRTLARGSEFVAGLGSGVIIDADGRIVTNYHVVKDASELAATLPDGTLHLARIVGVDPDSDIALIQVNATGLQPIAFADMDDVAVGDVVLAVGNPLGVGQAVTQGIVGAIVRTGMSPQENFIETDAAINPGNSGGALIDTAGRLVGINTAILSRSGGSEGIGFAIPVDYVQMIVSALKTKGHVARAWLRVTTAAPASGKGALVVAVQANGPADRGGVITGDVITRLGERNVAHPQMARSIVVGLDPGTHVPLEIMRSGKRASIDVELAPLPADEAQ